MFKQRIRQVRESHQVPQRVLAAALEIDTATYCKIEKGERKAKREQVSIIAGVLKANPEELLALWLADQVTAVITDDNKELSAKVLDMVKKNLKQ